MYKEVVCWQKKQRSGNSYGLSTLWEGHTELLDNIRERDFKNALAEGYERVEQNWIVIFEESICADCPCEEYKSLNSRIYMTGLLVSLSCRDAGLHLCLCLVYISFAKGLTEILKIKKKSVFI